MHRLPLFLLVLPACSFTIVQGNGDTTTVVRNVEASDAVRLAGGFDAVVVTDGDLDVVEITCDSNLIDHIVTEVVGDELVLRPVQGESLNPRGDCWVDVKLSQPPRALDVSGSGRLDALGRLPDLQEARVSGSGELVVEDGADICDLQARVSGSGSLDLGALTGCALDSNVSGSGELTASGIVASLEAGISGSGDLELHGLTTASADISVSGSGDATVTVTEALRARVSGSGSIEVHGNPNTRDVDVSGSGEVEFR